MTIVQTNKASARERSLLRFRRSVGRDLLTKTKDFCDFADELRADRTYGYRVRLEHRSGGQALARTDFGDERWIIDGTSNDYLGLATDDRVTSAVVDAVQRHGVGAQGAGMLNGNSIAHAQLEHELAAFLGFEAVMLVPSGFGAMQGTCQALLTPTDAVFADKYCHSSIEAGLRLGGGRIYRYPHRNAAALERLLEDHRDKHRGALIVTDGVFSTEGTVADVPALIDLARRFECRLMVDDAHGIGVLGPGGRGCGTGKGVDILGGTLSKSFGSGGGFVASDRATIEYLRLFAVSACTTTNLSIANAAGAHAALQVIRSEPARQTRLATLIEQVRSGLRRAGLDVGSDPTPIINITVGRDSLTYERWRELFDHGLLTHALPFPIVPHGKSAIRFRLTLSMTPELANRAVEIIGEVFTDRRPTPSDPATGLAQNAALDARATPTPGFADATDITTDRVETSIGELAVHRRAGSGRSVVLLHPLLFGSDTWLPVLSRLPAEADVVMIDAPGHGLSGNTAPDFEDSLSLQDVANGFFEALDATEIHGPFTLAGSSMGGMTALRMALLRPSSVGGMVLIGTSADPEEGPSREAFEPLVDVARSIGPAALAEDVATLMFSSNYYHSNGVEMAAVLRTLAGLGPDRVAPVVTAVLDRSDLAAELANLNAPAIILVGDEDVAEPPPHSERLANGLPDGAIRVLSGCGHLVQLEQPDHVAAAIEALVKRAISE